MVLAAGRGERMRPLTAEQAKPALPVLGRSLLARIVQELTAAGVAELSVNAWHGAESLAAALGEEPLDVELFREPRLMGTGGALAAPAARLGRHPVFLLHNGDTLAFAPLAALGSAAAEEGALGALLVRRGRASGYGGVIVDEGRVTGTFTPGDDAVPAERAAAYLGVGALRRELLERVPRDRPSELFPDVLLPALSGGGALRALVYEGPWLEFTAPLSYRDLLVGLVASAVPGGTLDLPGGAARLAPGRPVPVFVGEGAHVDPSARLGAGVVVERGARIEAGAELERTVVLDGAHVGTGAHLAGVVVDAAAVVPRESVRDECVLTGGADGRCEEHPLVPGRA
jgi:mannose-1-phosphate guanylyltransferase